MVVFVVSEKAGWSSGGLLWNGKPLDQTSSSTIGIICFDLVGDHFGVHHLILDFHAYDDFQNFLNFLETICILDHQKGSLMFL